MSSAATSVTRKTSGLKLPEVLTPTAAPTITGTAAAGRVAGRAPRTYAPIRLFSCGAPGSGALVELTSRPGSLVARHSAPSRKSHGNRGNFEKSGGRFSRNAFL